MSAIKEISDASFETDVIKSEKPVLVDFWAEWCGPCRQVGPILEEIASEYGDRITIAKLNVDENPAIPQEFNVIQIPTMNVFKDGEVVKQIIGARPKAMLMRDLEDVI